MRLCTVLSMLAVSRIRRDCHRNAKPSISTTKPVAENSVTASVVSARHADSTTVRRCVIASWPSGALMSRSASRMREPSASVISETPGMIVTAAVCGSRPIASLSLRPTKPFITGCVAMIVLVASVSRTMRPAAVARGQSTRSNARKPRVTASPDSLERQAIDALGEHGRDQVEFFG